MISSIAGGRLSDRQERRPRQKVGMIYLIWLIEYGGVPPLTLKPEGSFHRLVSLFFGHRARNSVVCVARVWLVLFPGAWQQ